MKNLTVFLDSSTVLSFLQSVKDFDVPSYDRLFAEEILHRVQYLISPIVYQEVILAGDRHVPKEKSGETQITEFLVKLLDTYVHVVQIDATEIQETFHKIRTMTISKNLRLHTIDMLILQSALATSDYLLTLDQELLKADPIESLRIISPQEFLTRLEVRR